MQPAWINYLAFSYLVVIFVVGFAPSALRRKKQQMDIIDWLLKRMKEQDDVVKARYSDAVRTSGILKRTTYHVPSEGPLPTKQENKDLPPIDVWTEEPALVEAVSEEGEEAEV